MSITEAGQGPLFLSLSKNLKYKTQTLTEIIIHFRYQVVEL